MCEQEIFDHLEKMCVLDELCYEVDCLDEKDLEVIRELIKLYNKQKEENNKNYYEWRHLEAEVSNNYISKDKIRDKIRQFKAVKQEIFRVENKLGIPSITYDIVRNDYCEKMLEDLLKE